MQPNKPIHAVVLGAGFGCLNFCNRTSVFFQWASSYFTCKRSARLITNLSQKTGPHMAATRPTPVLVPL